MKVLMISGVFYPKINGAVVAVSNMMSSLLARGHAVTLVTRRERGAPASGTWEGARIIRVGGPGYAISARISLAFHEFLAGWRLARMDPPDVIHAHGFTSLLAGAALSLSLRRPVVVSFHGVPRLWSPQARWRGRTTLQLTLPLEILLLKSASMLVAQSSLLKKVIMSLYRVPAGRVTVVPNPVDVKKFVYGSPRPRQDPVILFVGSLMRVHGPDVLLEAVPDILKRFPTAKIVIVGKGPLKEQLIGRIDSLRVGSNVELLDEVRDSKKLSEIYRTARVVVVPLRYTGYIMSLVGEEAMASGRPVVTTMTLDEELSRFGVIEAGGGGGSLADAVGEPLSWDDERYSEVSLSARRYAEQKFSLEAVGTQLERVYMHAIGRVA
jgi:glycosyltransferase involved in cell wall biosynthesis